MTTPGQAFPTPLPNENTALEIVTKLLTKSESPLYVPEVFQGQDIIRVYYDPNFDLSSVETSLRERLDEIGWQFVTTGLNYSNEDGSPLRGFGIAPIVLRPEVKTAYHATRRTLIPVILRDGLLPSSPDRRTTDFPDTDGKIHVCEELSGCGEVADCAEWWANHLAKNNLFDDSEWGIVAVELGAVSGVRVYVDIHSRGGLVIDRIDRIPPQFIHQVDL